MLLGSMRKERETAAKLNADKQKSIEAAEEASRRDAEEIKRLTECVAFDFSESLRHRTLAKITAAAKKYDPKNASAKSLKGFEGASMNIPTFR